MQGIDKITEEDVRYFLSNMTNYNKQFARLAVPHNINNIIFAIKHLSGNTGVLFDTHFSKFRR